MSTSDGSILGTTKIVDHGPDSARFNIVILGDGYQSTEMDKYHTDVASFVQTFQGTAPYTDLFCGINFHRVDVTSTDSGAKDPSTCGDGSTGTGASPKTFFDSTFCGDGNIRRLLTCDSTSAQNVASTQVPQVNMTMVIVNTTEYGGSGGQVATFSTASQADEIGLHEMGHTAFGLTDEYPTYAGCNSGETGHDHYTGGEPSEPNATINTDKTTIKWKAVLTSNDNLPTTTNADCTKCDPQGNPKSSDYVGAYEGARYFHCGCYRGSFECRMNALGFPFCAVCQKVIRDTLAPYMPAPVTLTWPNPADIVYGTALGPTQLDATAPVTGTFTYTPPAGDVLFAGSYILSVFFAPDDFADFCFASASVPLNVLKATPTINWANPPDIDHGTPLDNTQLNATASAIVGGASVFVAGTFVYTPPAGTVLPVGTQTLSVLFTPFDTSNYNPATATVLLNVLTGTPIVTSATFSPTTLQWEQRVQVTVTVKNDSISPHPSQGPDPGFEYSEGDTFQTKGFPSIPGDYRIGVDLQETTYKVGHPYRWGFGHTLAPGESVTVNGFIRFHNSRHNGHYYVGMLEEVDNVIADNIGTTGITVERP